MEEESDVVAMSDKNFDSKNDNHYAELISNLNRAKNSLDHIYAGRPYKLIQEKYTLDKMIIDTMTYRKFGYWQGEKK